MTSVGPALPARDSAGHFLSWRVFAASRLCVKLEPMSSENNRIARTRSVANFDLAQPKDACVVRASGKERHYATAAAIWRQGANTSTSFSSTKRHATPRRHSSPNLLNYVQSSTADEHT